MKEERIYPEWKKIENPEPEDPDTVSLRSMGKLKIFKPRLSNLLWP